MGDDVTLEYARSVIVQLEADRARLRDALAEIATLTWNPVIGLPAPSYYDLHYMARQALDPK